MSSICIKSACAILLLVLSGCGSSQAPVRGTVTFNGKNVDDGFINFNPLDTKNPTYGTTIENGKYSTKINPGSYTVMVTGGGKMKAYPKSQADLKAIPDKDLQLTDEVPNDAKGNGQKVEIKPGGQELNIALESLKARK